MTNPPILTIGREGLRGIIERGKPEGLWMAESSEFPKIWSGVDSRPGHLTLMHHGTFPEVLTWLMRRAGIIRPREDVEVRNASRDPEYHIAKTTGAELRIAGAEIRTMPEPHGGNPGQRKRDALTRRMEAEHAQERDREINAEILRRLKRGQIYREIGEAVGISVGAVSDRIRRMKQRGVDVPPLRAEREKDRVRKRDGEILTMLRRGMSVTEISEELGCSYNLVYKKMRGYKRREEV